MPAKRKLDNSEEKSALDDPKYDLCLQRVFAHLPIADRFKMRKVCKRWKKVSEMPWEDMTKLNCANSWTSSGTYVIEVTLPRLEQVLRLCGNNLTHLDFSGRQIMADCQPMDFDADVEFFTLLATHCPKLQILDIYFLTPTPKGVAYMADHYNGIADLRIYDYDSKCNKALSSFFKKARKLEAITFYGHRKHRSCLVDLPVATMKKIHMETLHDESYEQLVSVLERCQNLESFSVENSCLKENRFIGITRALSRNAKSLKQLEISKDSSSIGTPLAIQPSHFAEFKNLQELKLSIEGILSDELLEIIGKNCRQLKSVLFIRSGNVSDRGMKALPNLERVDLRALTSVKGQFLAKMSNLKRVYLGQCGITDRSLHLLLDVAPNLEFLDFRSGKYHGIKELVLHALDVTKRRKTRIPLEIVFDGQGKVKEFKRDLLSVRNAV